MEVKSVGPSNALCLDKRPGLKLLEWGIFQIRTHRTHNAKMHNRVCIHNSVEIQKQEHAQHIQTLEKTFHAHVYKVAAPLQTKMHSHECQFHALHKRWMVHGLVQFSIRRHFILH